MAEQNRPTLQTALQTLTQYDPPAEIWGQIEQQLDRQSTDSSLYQAMERLPMYEPPVAAWEQIEDALTKEQSEQSLQNALRQLPKYEPPQQLWTNIQQSLDKEASLQSALQQLPVYDPPAKVWDAIDREIQEPKRQRIVKMRNWLARAAAIAALIVGTWYFWPQDYAAIQAAYIHQTEQAGSAWTATTDWSTDEAAIQQAVSTFKQDPLAQNQDNYDQLLEEWKELNEAKAEIADIMDRYGKDARLIRQMSEIERERSSVLRKMVREI